MQTRWLSSRLVWSLALLASACSGKGAPAPATPQAAAAPPSGDPAHNLLKQATFDDGVMLPWMTSFSEPASGEAKVKDKALCVHVENGGKDRWDAQVRHREMKIQHGHEYTLSFRAWASRPTSMAGKVGMAGPPYGDYWTKKLELTTEPQPFFFQFKMTKEDDATAELAFHIGGRMIKGPGPVDICLDDVILSDAKFDPPPLAAKVPLPAVRVNQLGYLPRLAKIATLVSDAAQPLDWKLLDDKGKEVAAGKTQVVGKDAASGDSVHLIDFSSFTATGKGFVLAVGDQKSDAFEIDAGLYAGLRNDALKYFYYTRSGIALEKPYISRDDLAHAAGHMPDKAACAKDIGCDYTLDVTGGWYDAGDYGKYVVNGGISVWTLLDAYERDRALNGKKTFWGEQKDFIPESKNKVADILDEARWELEFFLKMQVPAGKPYEGMVHHKMHDTQWSALGAGPHESKLERRLRPVSTAATLNAAATWAQAARIWKDIDKKFSATCLAAAETAWKAAKKNPAVLAKKEDTVGGGPYDDDHIEDELYWAAAELYVTTGQQAYLDEVKKSPLDADLSATGGDPDGVPGAMSWGRVDALGKISLALVPSKLPAADRDRYRQQIVKVGKSYAEVLSKQGYRVPFAPSKKGDFPWGSNSFVLNNLVVMGLAYDFSKDPMLLNAVATGMDYLLGRNALARSYVTGYGARPLEHPHHRFWANQADPRYPKPPAGIVSGGPNNGLQDPYVKAAGLAGCAPHKCFVDHIEAWSANEITINWNSPLVWVVDWLDQHAR